MYNGGRDLETIVRNIPRPLATIRSVCWMFGRINQCHPPCKWFVITMKGNWLTNPFFVLRIFAKLFNRNAEDDSNRNIWQNQEEGYHRKGVWGQESQV